ncbi:restriction endonuclease subunit S, partial [Mycoplasma sp. Z244B]|uniref:restriction endonuclease subunit S n=2 Tax=unclassified Mycoplasma TaxID=2683645 RepID=UPI003AAD9732
LKLRILEMEGFMQKEKLVPAIRFKGFDEEWEVKKINQILSPIVSNLTMLCIQEKGLYPVYDANNIVGYSSYALSSVPYLTIIKDGAGVGRTRKLPANSSFLGTMTGLTPKNSDIDFTYNLISSLKLEKNFSGSTIPHIYFSDYGKYLVYVPSIIEQEKIGKFFSSLDLIIESQKSKLENLQTIKRSLLGKMFASENQKIPEIRFKGFDEPWKLNKFSDLYNCNNEKNINIRYTEKNIISVANMYFKNEQKISNTEYLKSYNIFHLGDIAYEGNKSANYRYGRFVVNTIGSGIVSHVFEVFKPVMKEYDLYFWKYYINNENIMRNVLRDSTKSATMMATLVKKDLSNQFIKTTSIVEQQKIGAFFSNLDSLISSQELKLEKLNNLKQALLEKMFC